MGNPARRLPLVPLLLPALLLPTACTAPAAPPPDDRPPPNILFVFTDDHASHAIGAYGSALNRTPHLDRLASEGMLFQNCFCTNSICAPSRAVILTGKHSHRNGVIKNGIDFDGSQPTAPKLLRQAGYQTAMIGKWHLRSEPTGFDFWKVLIGQGTYYNPVLRTPEGKEELTGYTTDLIADVAIDWLENGRDPDRPFLLMCQHKAPHRSWEPGPEKLSLFDGESLPEPPTLFDDWSGRTTAAAAQTMTVERHLTDRDLKLVPPGNLTEEQLARWNAAYDPKNQAFREAELEGQDLVRWKYQRYIKDYLRCVDSVDDSVGRLLDWLDESGLAENTVVIYSSDQGFYLGDHGWFDKRWMYEESLRMPLIVRWPGRIEPGSVNAELVQNLDFAETFLDLAGAPVPEDMQGASLVPLLRGRTPAGWRESIYYHYWEYPAVHDVQRHFGVRTDRYKLIHYYGIGEWELFDLERDPLELGSVHADPAYAAVVERLEAELARLQRQCGDTDPQAPLSVYTQRGLRQRAGQVELARVPLLDGPEGEIPDEPDPTGKPLTVGARCTPRSGSGVLMAHGGEHLGWSLYLLEGRPHFGVRDNGVWVEVVGERPLPANRAVHVAGVLDAASRLRLYVDGELAASGPGQLVGRRPADPLDVGSDSGSAVGEYEPPLAFDGTLEDVRLYWGALDQEALREWAR